MSPAGLPAIRRKLIGDQIEALLRTLTDVTYYRGEVPDAPPLIETDGITDPSGRVAPYVVQFTGSGTPYVNAERDVADTHDDLTAVHQVTCVAGYEADCLHLVDQVDHLLRRWTPTAPGLAFGRLTPPPGYDPGQPRRDNTLQGSPPRYFVPLQYRLDVTT